MEVSASAPELEAALIASASSFPEGEPVVPFELVDIDLTPYVVSTSMSITTDVTAKRPEQDTLVEARFTLEVQATPQGVKNQLD